MLLQESTITRTAFTPSATRSPFAPSPSPSSYSYPSGERTPMETSLSEVALKSHFYTVNVVTSTGIADMPDNE